MSAYAAALAGAVAAARAAGDLLRPGLAHQGQARRYDSASERLLRQHLRALAPYGYLSDEAGFLPGADASHVWVADPNDGTFHYNHGRRGSAVSVALLRAGVPVLGVVHAFAYPGVEGDLIAWAEDCGPITRNGLPVAPRDHPPIVYLSPGQDTHPRTAADRVAPARFITLPSLAYRLALVACGEGAAAVSLNSPSSYDYAAGHALLRAAGCVLLDGDGAPLAYTAEGGSGCTRCFGGTPSAVLGLLRQDWAAPASSLEESPQPFRARRFGPVRMPAHLTIPDAGILSRVQGGLLGQLAGDSLGGLVEFDSAEDIARHYPAGVRDLADGGTWRNAAGQPTDDSELALLLARSIVEAGCYDEALALSAYADWVNDPQTFDVGGTTARALRSVRPHDTHGQRLEAIQRHANHASEANGSLMRCSPIGLHVGGDWRHAADLARRDSRLTHPNPVCVDACAAYCVAVSFAVATGDAERSYGMALEVATEPSVRAALEAARHGPPPDYERSMGHVLIALRNAFFQLLHAPSFEEGVVRTVMAGGDTDTNAAIAGALLGAVHGRDAVPARWGRTLLSCRPLPGLTAHPRAREFWPVDALELAEAVFLTARAPDGSES